MSSGEREVKMKVRAYLESIGCVPAAKAAGRKDGIGYFFMPVAGIGGVSGIPDFVGHYRGFFFAIETKVEKKNPTALQAIQIETINRTGAKAFVVRGCDDLGEIREWVEKINQAELIEINPDRLNDPLRPWAVVPRSKDYQP